MSRRRNLTTMLILATAGVLCCASLNLRAETVRDRLWIWGRPAGIYNNTHFRPLGFRSTVEPVDGAKEMGIPNVIFIATENLGPLMEKQAELGLQWLKSGRIAGIIFLSTGTVGAGLETVDWTRQWICTRGDDPLPTDAFEPAKR